MCARLCACFYVPAEGDPFALCIRIHAALKGYWGRLSGGRNSPKIKSVRLYLLRATSSQASIPEILRLFKDLRRLAGLREQTARANKLFFVLRAGNEVLTF